MRYTHAVNISKGSTAEKKQFSEKGAEKDEASLINHISISKVIIAF